METREWMDPGGLARLRRGDDRLRPRTRLAHASNRSGRMDRVDEHLQMGGFLRTIPRQFPAALRTSVLAHLDRFPRNSGCVHARQRDRLLRELTPSDGVAALICGGQSGEVYRLRC